MAISRYFRSSIVNRNNLSNRSTSFRINDAVMKNQLSVTTLVSTPGERLDIIAGKYYGESQYWWVIAAASGIGWNLQIPPGTLLKVPLSIEQVLALL